MGDIYGKHIKRYVDRLTVELKTYLIHDPGHYSDDCKVLGDFSTKYAKGNPTKDHGNNTAPRKNLRGSRKNAIVHNVADEFLFNETKKLSAAREAPENLDSDYDENYLYQVEKRVLKRLKKKLIDISVHLNANRRVHM